MYEIEHSIWCSEEYERARYQATPAELEAQANYLRTVAAYANRGL